MKKLLLILVAILYIQVLQSQEIKELIGLIENENGEPLISANVVNCKGTSRFGGTCTDMNGMFELSTNVDSVEITYLGYKTVKLSVRVIEQDPFIIMKKASIGLPEFVVTGYAIGKGKTRWCGLQRKERSEMREKKLSKSKIDYKIYPNPSTNIVILDIPRQNEGEITLITPNGIELHREHMKSSKLEIDLGRYPAGSYYIKYEEQEIIEILGPIIKVSN